MSLRLPNLRPTQAIARPGQLIIPNRPPNWRSLEGASIIIGTDGGGTFGFVAGQYGSLQGESPPGAPAILRLTAENVQIVGATQLQTQIQVEFEGGLVSGLSTFLINDGTMPDYRTLYLRPQPNVASTTIYEGQDPDSERGDNWAAELGNAVSVTTQDTTGNVDSYLQSRYIEDGNDASVTFQGGNGNLALSALFKPLLMQSQNAEEPSNAREYMVAGDSTEGVIDTFTTQISGLPLTLGPGNPTFDTWWTIAPQTTSMKLNAGQGEARAEISLRYTSGQQVFQDRRVYIFRRL